MAEADFDLGIRINDRRDAPPVEQCPARWPVPRVVSRAPSRCTAGDLPDIISETTALNPQTSY